MDKFDVLNKMVTINIDLETLGVDPVRDQIYSGAVYSTKEGTGSKQAASFFDIDKGQYPSGMPLDEFLASRHSSQFFGKEQLKRKSLQGWADSVQQGGTTSLTNFVDNILEHKNSSKDGAILLAQNISFEDRAISAAYKRGEIDSGSFSNLVSQFISKGDVANGNFFKPQDITDMNWERYRILDDKIRPSHKMNNAEGLKQGLQEYYDQSMKIIDTYMDHFNTASSQDRIATADLMDFSKALYAHGAVQGKLDPRLLTYGTKVDYLAEVLLNQSEQHEAMSDAVQQDKLFKIMTSELKNIKEQGVGYNSPIVDKLARNFEKHKVLEKQVKSSATSFLREYLESPKTVDTSLEAIQKNAMDNFLYRNRFIAEEGTVEGFNFGRFRQDLDGIIKKAHDIQTAKTSPFDRGVFLNDVEEMLNAYEHSPGAKDKSRDFIRKHLNNKTTLAVAGGAAALFAGSMLFGGNKEKQKEVKYNTYDELYNSQYYGTQFADWQNRNNSHRMM